MNTSNEDKSVVTRRNFIQKAVVGAGAAAAALSVSAKNLPGVALAADAPASDEAKPIRIPSELEAAKNAPLKKIDFPMTGAQVFASACKDEGVAAMFCCPGNYDVIHAVAEAGIPVFGGRHEGATAHAADAFIRVSGEIAMCSGTEGPGFTNMISAIGGANAAYTPLLVVASNSNIKYEDTYEGAQHFYQQPTTEGMKKYGKRLTAPDRVHEYAATAFRQLRSGVPRPVHLDFPSEICQAKFKDASELTYYYDKTKYRTESRAYPSPKEIAAAVKMIQAASRPIIVSGTGVFYAKAWDPLKRLVEKAQIPVVESGAMKGQFSDASPLSANESPDALASADLVLVIGQYCLPVIGEWAFGPHAKYIRIDPSQEDIGRCLPIDLGIVSDEKAGLEALAEAVPSMKHDSWVAEIAAARKKFEDENDAYYKLGMSYTDAVHPAVIAKGFSDFLYNGRIPRDQTVVVAGGFGFGRYMRRVIRAYRPGQVMVAAYQWGAIGPDIGYAVGMAAAVQLGAGAQAAYRGHPIICCTGDMGVAYTVTEIETLARYRLPAVIIVYNNNASGTWTMCLNSPKAMPLHLYQENLRYEKIADGLGGHGEYVTRPADFRPALERAYDIAAKESVPVLLNVQGKKEHWLKDKFPPGFVGKVEPGCMSYQH